MVGQKYQRNLIKLITILQGVAFPLKHNYENYTKMKIKQLLSGEHKVKRPFFIFHKHFPRVWRLRESYVVSAEV